MKFSSGSGKVVCAVLVSWAMLLGPGATAATLGGADRRGDLVSTDDDGEVWTPRPQRAEGDITAYRVTHRSKTVRVRIQFAELAKVDNGSYHILHFKTARAVYHYDLDATYGRWAGRSYIDKESTSGRKKSNPCQGRTHKIDYAKNTVLIVIPRVCIGTPKSVRLSIQSHGYADGIYHSDDARTKGTVPEHSKLAYGPRVKRG